jgi:hypothetical protein
MTSLNSHELGIIYKTVLRAEKAKKEKINNLSDIFVEKPRLIITPSNMCFCSCTHCVADSTPAGTTMSYDDFISINPEFFQLFSVVDFGRRGNPLLYNSGGHDVVDLLNILNKQGIDEFTLALAIQNKHVSEIERLVEFTKNKRTSIDTMITYHHYRENLDIQKVARDFNMTLKNYMEFSKKIIISLLGDQHSQSKSTKAEEVETAFKDNWQIIFSDLKLNQVNDKTYLAEYHNKKSELFIPSIDTRVYPLGRFRKYLENKGILKEYGEKFEKSMGDYICPDLVRWPGIILEPDGSLNLCASFEAITCRGAIITNIFEKEYSQVKDELIQFHKKELNWFIDNLPEIIEGKVSTCKIKNKCYQN